MITGIDEPHKKKIFFFFLISKSDIMQLRFFIFDAMFIRIEDLQMAGRRSDFTDYSSYQICDQRAVKL